MSGAGDKDGGSRPRISGTGKGFNFNPKSRYFTAAVNGRESRCRIHPANVLTPPTPLPTVIYGERFPRDFPAAGGAYGFIHART